MRSYDLDFAIIKTKYKSYQGVYYSKKLEATAKGHSFNDPLPSGNISDNALYMIDKADKGIAKFGEKVQAAWDKSGIENKIRKLF